MSFTNHLRQLAKSIWNAQITHPFVLALGNGTLPERESGVLHPARRTVSRPTRPCVSAGALRAPDSDSALRFAKLAEETITVERSLHENYGRRWKMTGEGNVVCADGADELRLHQAHAHRRPYRLGSGDHSCRPPLRLDLLRHRTLRECAKYQKEGQFATGSMGPKIEAACRFVSSSKKKATITSLESALQALDGKTGTTITYD